MVDISIIVPVYNAGEYLEQCIISLINQTYENIEFIFVNGNSTDNSLDVLMKYSHIDERIKIVNKENEGVSISRNIGLEMAVGEYIMFVDADDWIEKNTCEIVLHEAKISNADVVMWSYIREFGNVSQPKLIFDSERIEYGKEQVKKLHRRFIGLIGSEVSKVENADALCPVWGKLYRKDIIDGNAIQFQDIRKIGTYEDGLFNLHYFEYVQSAVYIQQYLYHYRKNNENSITSKYKKDLFIQWQSLFEMMDDYIKTKKLSREYTEALNNRICLSILGQGLNLLGASDSHISKIRKIKFILNSKKYQDAYKNFSLKYLPIHWKVFYGCAKYRLSTATYILLLCIKQMIGR